MLAITFLIFSITKGGSIDGFVRVSELFSEGLGFSGILALIQSFLYLINCFLSSYTIMIAHYQKNWNFLYIINNLKKIIMIYQRLQNNIRTHTFP